MPATTMLEKISELSGRLNRREIPVEQAKLDAWQNDPNADLIQFAFPELSDDDREFILTGATPEEWDEMMGVEETGPVELNF